MSDTEAFDTLFDDKARAAHAAGPVGYDEEGVRQAVRLFLKSIGEDPDREGLLDTPDRIGRACKELFAGLGHGPEEYVSCSSRKHSTKRNLRKSSLMSRRRRSVKCG